MKYFYYLKVHIKKTNIDYENKLDIVYFKHVILLHYYKM